MHERKQNRDRWAEQVKNLVRLSELDFETVFWLHELELGLRLSYYGAVSYAPWWQEAGNHGA